MKIVTWNVNSLKVRLPQVLECLEKLSPDVLALQELKLDQAFFPEAQIKDAAYHASWLGQKTYNGVAFLSKEPPEKVVYGLPNYPDPQSRVITIYLNGTVFVNVYCVNGEALDSEKFIYKTAWFAALTDYLKTLLSSHQKVVVMGDFNIAPTDIDVYDPKKWHEKILCSTEERSWFQAILDLGFYDALRVLNPDEALFTWWDYRMNGFKRNLGMRIDHILLTAPLKNGLEAYGVDKDIRSWERPSDHAPVWVDYTPKSI